MAPIPGSAGDEAARHKALGEKTRIALLGALEGSHEPLDVRSLASRVGLHVNTVRWHLGVLADAGLVVEETARSGARGRPRHGYRLAEAASSGLPGGFALLAEVLVDALAHREPDVEALEEAGKVRGRMLVRPRLGAAGHVGAGEALGEIVQLLDRFGFQPRLEHAAGGDRIAMRPCPFGEMANRHSSIVCPVHLGLMRGTLEALDAPVEATLLEPFAEPDLCVAHFRTAHDA